MSADGDRVRVGVVGTTWYAERHIAAVAEEPGAELVAVCGRDADKAREVADRYGAAATFQSYERMIDSGTIDAVVILAPDPLHAPIALAAADAGLHVMCEKPLATTSDEAHRMWRAAEDAGVRHMSFFFLRNTPVHRRAHELVADGAIGRIASAELSLTHGFFRDGRYDWRFDAALGTGAIGDLGCYLFELALWHVGDVERVSVASSASVRPKPDGTASTAANDAASGTLAFVDGAHATFGVSVNAVQADRLQSHVTRLFGTDGTIEVEHTLVGGSLRIATGDDEVFREIETVPGSPHGAGVADFVGAIVEGRPTDSTFEHGWRVQQVVEAAVEADRAARWVPVAAA